MEHNVIRNVGNGLNTAGMETWNDPNGTPVTISIPPGSYTWDGIVATLNALLSPGPGLVCQTDYGFVIRAMPAGDAGGCGGTGNSRG